MRVKFREAVLFQDQIDQDHAAEQHSPGGLQDRRRRIEAPHQVVDGQSRQYQLAIERAGGPGCFIPDASDAMFVVFNSLNARVEQELSALIFGGVA